MATKRFIKVAALFVVALIVLGCALCVAVVPETITQLVKFEMTRESRMRASGFVDREPSGTRIYWEEYGVASGPPVVVLHGAFGAISNMAPQIGALEATHRIVALDSRGHNKSTNTGDKLTYELMSDDTIAVMDTLKVGRADIVGWSDGGNIGIDLARRYPDRVRKVVAFGAVYNSRGADAKTIKQMREATHDASSMAPIRSMFPDEERWPTFFKQVQTMLLTEPQWTLEQLGTIRAPILLVNGEHDLVLRSHAEEMRATIPGARLEIVAGAGHDAPLEHHDQVNPLMLKFLQTP